jgi:hypothetical protein
MATYLVEDSSKAVKAVATILETAMRDRGVGAQGWRNGNSGIRQSHSD